MKERKDRDKGFLTGAKGALVLIIASAGSVALFFAVARVVDIITFNTSNAQPRRLLPFESPPLPAAGNNEQKNAPKNEPPLKLGFYTDLLNPKQNNGHPVFALKKEETKSVSLKPSAENPAPETAAADAGLKKSANNSLPAKNTQETAGGVQEPPAAAVHYVLQLGAFQKAEKAQLVVSELQQAGYTAYTDTITVPGKGTLIRVRVGTFSTMSEARKRAAEIQGKTKIPVLISTK
jgi:cell division septation protein DedD